LHHFDDKQGFIRQARRLLRPGGALATIGLDVPSAIAGNIIATYQKPEKRQIAGSGIEKGN
jgi:ubiquinone/menaquinone biosynthesis C-methylase UbiE